jgi:hypothetical protein
MQHCNTSIITCVLRLDTDPYLHRLAAARRNDLATVKQLTLAHWGSNFEFSPIAVANIDKPPELSAFSAAATSGNYNLAKTIIFIAVVQHTAPSTVQYSIAKLFQNGEDVYSKLADHSFPTNAVQAVSKLVKNTITPMDMVLHCNFHLHNVVGRERNPELLKFAIQTRCLFPPMLKDLPFQRHIFGRGIEFGWTDVLEEQIRAMGSPFEHRIQDDKLVIGRALPREYQTAPLLQAARAGKLQVVQFFESEKSMDAYRQFAMTHTFDTRKKSLEKSREEFLGRVKTWFNQRRTSPWLLNPPSIRGILGR